MSRIHEQIKKHEGTGPIVDGNFMPYKDSKGLLTIGYGICIEKTGLRPEEAEYLLRSRISEAEEECLISFSWFSDLESVRQGVIVDMVFNMGMPRFKGFKKTIGYMSVGDHQSASIEMLRSRWAVQVGSRADNLSKAMRTGQWED
jgi:lysozyme